MDKIEVTRRPHDILRIAPNNFTELLRITPAGEVIAPSLEAASEAGRYFVESMRGHLEVMREAIRAEVLATRTDATPVAWMPIESAPHACHVLAGRLDPDVGEWIMQVVASPPIQPFTHWQPLPAAPDHIEEPRAMVPDVAALVDALVAHNDALRSASQVAYRDGKDTNWLTFRGAITYTLAEHHDTVNAARQALAPFTKGQP